MFLFHTIGWLLICPVLQYCAWYEIYFLLSIYLKLYYTNYVSIINYIIISNNDNNVSIINYIILSNNDNNVSIPHDWLLIHVLFYNIDFRHVYCLFYTYMYVYIYMYISWKCVLFATGNLFLAFYYLNIVHGLLPLKQHVF